LRFAPLDELPDVAIGAEALGMILGHLLSNAREAIATSGSITLEVRQTELTSRQCLTMLGNALAGPHLEVCVTDTGSGISPEVRERLFIEPFFSTKPRHRGLGLASVYGLLYVHHGAIRLEPGSERGTTVSFWLPLAGSEVLPPPAPALAPLDGDRESVLVVDDDPLTLQLMCVTLERAGYRVQPASDGEQAFATFVTAAEPFRLVLSDVAMPGMSGFDLAQRLLDRDPSIPVLFTSGHVPPGTMPECLCVRRLDMLPKPFRPDGLLRAVRRALSGTAAPASLEKRL
jgi:CheY-like chemotaxis protein